MVRATLPLVPVVTFSLVWWYSRRCRDGGLAIGWSSEWRIDSGLGSKSPRSLYARRGMLWRYLVARA